MPLDLPPRPGGARPDGLGLGLISGLLLAIPLWAGIGASLVVLVLHRPFAVPELAALTVAAVVEALVILYAWRQLGWRFGLRRSLAWAGPALRASGARSTPLRRMGLLTVLAAAFLHYYYWDVQTQIAMLPAITVFVPTPRLG